MNNLIAKFIELTTKHPEYPIITMTSAEVISDTDYYYAGKIFAVEVNQVYFEDNLNRVYTDVDDWETDYYEYNLKEIYGDETSIDDLIKQLFKPTIVLYINNI